MASRYHMASRLLSAASTTSGLYRSRLEQVVGGLQRRLLAFGSLLLHRLVEEHRFALLLAELEEGHDIYMTRSPQAESPDEEREGNDIARWSRENIRRIRKLVRERAEKVRALERDYKELVRAIRSIEDWLGPAVLAYAYHMELLGEVSENPASRERKAVDRDESLRDPHFDKKPPKLPKAGRPLFSDRPEAERWGLRQWGNIYKHGRDPDRLNPMSLDHEAHAAAALLEKSMDELRSKPWESWSRSTATDDEGHPYPSLLDAVHGFLTACRVAIAEDDAAVASEWDRLRAIDLAPLQMTGAKKGKWVKKKRWDWDSLADFTEKTTFEERVERKKRKYKRDKLGRFSK